MHIAEMPNCNYLFEKVLSQINVIYETKYISII